MAGSIFGDPQRLEEKRQMQEGQKEKCIEGKRILEFHLKVKAVRKQETERSETKNSQ